MALLELDGLTKEYNKVLANDAISFSMQAGEVTVMAGPNGAGKSTAIKCIAGLLRFTGHIRIDGHPNKTLEAKRALGYVPEMPALYDLLTVEEHLEFIARAYRLEDGWKERAQHFLELFELEDKKLKAAKELSKGMQQKVSLCCALLPKPKLLLMDEPMVGLDPHAIRQLKLLISQLAKEGCGILISTHMLESVSELWDKVLILSKGKVAAVRERKEEGQEAESLEDLFFRITEGGEG